MSNKTDNKLMYLQKHTQGFVTKLRSHDILKVIDRGIELYEADRGALNAPQWIDKRPPNKTYKV